MSADRRLLVLAGPTAVGKGTVSAFIREHHPEVWLSVSMTTRPPRPGEVDGLHYHFVTPEHFADLVARGEMLEWAVVHGRNCYGTPRGPVEQALREGRMAMLEIDLQGARQVRGCRRVSIRRQPEASRVCNDHAAPEPLSRPVLLHRKHPRSHVRSGNLLLRGRRKSRSPDLSGRVTGSPCARRRARGRR